MTEDTAREGEAPGAPGPADATRIPAWPTTEFDGVGAAPVSIFEPPDRPSAALPPPRAFPRPEEIDEDAVRAPAAFRSPFQRPPVPEPEDATREGAVGFGPVTADQPPPAARWVPGVEDDEAPESVTAPPGPGGAEVPGVTGVPATTGVPGVMADPGAMAGAEVPVPADAAGWDVPAGRGADGAREAGGPGALATGPGPLASGHPSGNGPQARHSTFVRRRKQRSPLVGAITEIGLVLAMALTLSLLIKTFLVQAFFIPSASMENTLIKGDRVIVNKLVPGPMALHRGDVIVFKDPGQWLETPPPSDDGLVKTALRDALTFVGLLPQDSGEHLIKRVIGLPGDRVACKGNGAPVTVNGVAISEPYLYPGNDPSIEAFDIVVPPDHIWVMGDHREVSQDSRKHQNLPGGGSVPMSDIVGRAFVIVWPPSRMGGIGSPSGEFDKVPAPAGS